LILDVAEAVAVVSPFISLTCAAVGLVRIVLVKWKLG